MRPPHEVHGDGLSHSNYRIHKYFDLSFTQTGTQPMLCTEANRLILHSQRNAQQQRGLALSNRSQNCSGSSTRTSHGRDDHVGIQDQSHITYSIISHMISPKVPASCVAHSERIHIFHGCSRKIGREHLPSSHSLLRNALTRPLDATIRFNGPEASLTHRMTFADVLAAIGAELVLSDSVSS